MATPFKLQKLTGLENLIPEYDGTIVKYIEWRDTVERAFTIKGLTTLMIFGRYSKNPDDRYVCVEKRHDGTGDAANYSQAEVVVNLNQQEQHCQNIKQVQKERTVAKASAFKNGLSIAVNAAPTATIVQISFREILDEQFITEAVQEQQFQDSNLYQTGMMKIHMINI
ncbi:11155_t:CDS:2 [Gigaspora rosea]|nr:11155_t:CDS:2 [Gigaspora rosea]